MISIIIPVYKSEQYLTRCVNSIISQTYSDYEAILIDDGSPDKCPTMCDDFCSGNSHIRVLHQTNSGVSAARNAGLKAAQGEFICFLDSDDWIEPDFLSKLYDSMVQTGSDIIAADYTSCSDTQIKDSHASVAPQTVYGQENIRELYFSDDYNIHFSVWGKLFKKELLQDKQFPSISYGEDTVFMLQVLTDAESITYLDYQGYNYYINPGSLSQNRFHSERLLKEMHADELMADRLVFDYAAKVSLSGRKKAATWYTKGILTLVMTEAVLLPNKDFKKYRKTRKAHIRSFLRENSSERIYRLALRLYLVFPSLFKVFTKILV